MAMCAIYSHSNTPSLNYEDIASKFGIAEKSDGRRLHRLGRRRGLV